MSKKRNKTKLVETPEVEITEVESKEEETNMGTKKVSKVAKIFGGIKGFFTSKLGKKAAIVSIVVAGVTAAGVVIYKVFFEDGNEALIEADEMDNLSTDGEGFEDATKEVEETSEEVTEE